MNKLPLVFLAIFTLMLSCKDTVVPKPKKLIDENQMEDIIYDLSLLDAIKSQGYSNKQNYPSTTVFLKKKYNIDSVTFANNSKYYAADIKNYKKMYERVKERLNLENINLNGEKPSKDNEDQGVVK